MADLFISYSRGRDTGFVDRLSQALVKRGQHPWVDREGIYPSSPWAPEIQQAILEAPAFVFVISPESVASEYCKGELDRAIALGKRVVPLLAHQTPMESVPPELAQLHFLSFTGVTEGPGGAGAQDDAAFAEHVDRLVEVLVTDVEALHAHTRLLTQAARWSEHGEDRSMLLRGRELSAAEAWLTEQTGAAKTVLPAQLGFITASRRAATRRQRGSVAVSSAVALAMVALAIVAVLQRSQAVHQANVALARDLAAESQSASGTDVQTQGLLALASYKRSATAAGRSALVGAAEQPLEASLHASLGGVNAVAYDPHGPYLAAGYDGGIIIWDTATGKMVGQPFDTDEHVNGIAFSPNGKTLVAAQSTGQKGSAELFTTATHRAARRFAGDGGPVDSVAFSPNGTQVAGGTYKGNVYIWDTANDQSGHVAATTDGNVLSVAFSPNGSQLAAGGDIDLADGGVNGFADLYSGSLASPQTFTDTANTLRYVAFDPNGQVLAVADDAGTVALLSTSGLQKQGAVQAGSPVNAVAFDPSGDLFASGASQGGAQQWGATSFKQVGTTMETGSAVEAIAYSPTGTSLASGDEGGDVLVWSSPGLVPGAYMLKDGAVEDLAVSSSSNLLATTDNGSVSIWDLTKRNRARRLKGGGDLPAADDVDFSPDVPTLLAIGKNNGKVLLYDTATGRASALLDRALRKGSVVTTSFSPNGKELAAGYLDGQVVVWGLGDAPHIISSYPAPSADAGGITALVFSPDGSDLVVGYEGYGLQVFRPAAVTTKVVTVTLNEAAFSLAFTPDGKVLAVGDDDGDVELFNASTFRPEGTLPGDGAAVLALSVSPDGSTLAAADGGGELHLWDLDTHQELGSPLTSSAPVLGLAFAPDGKTLFTGDASGAIVGWPSVLWSNSLQDFSSDLCPVIGENLSKPQWAQLVPGQPYQDACPGYPPEVQAATGASSG